MRAWVGARSGVAERMVTLSLVVLLTAWSPVVAADFSVTNSGASAYVFSGAASGSNPDLTLTRGATYSFGITASGHPFWIKTVQVTGTQNAVPGVPNNGTAVGTITWTVPGDAPDTLFYICQFHAAMTGTIRIVGDTATSTPVTPSTPTATRTDTRTPTRTPSSTSTPTDTVTAVSTATRTPSSTPTESPAPTGTNTPTATNTPTEASTSGPCAGDCNQDRAVTVDELMKDIDVALGRTAWAACRFADLDRDGQVTVDEVVQAVRAALDGCPN